MSHLLPLKPEGMGTADVEGLASFFARLALLHSVSPYQLANHLREWTGLQLFGGGKTGRYAGRNSMLINGFGSSARWMIDWLTLGLDRSDLASTTLLIFEHVLPHFGAGVLRKSRAWCPACLRDWRRVGVVEYEKLTWFIRAITRCPLHEVQLVEHCPRCGEKQIEYRPKVAITSCGKCGGDLSDPHTPWIKAMRPGPGESDLIEIIARAASAPHFRYSAGTPKMFVKEFQRRTSRDASDGLNYCVGFRSDYFLKPSYRPALDTLIDLSLASEVPLPLILDHPIEAARVARLTPEFAFEIRPKPRSFRTRGKRERVWKALNDALADEHANAISLRELCRTEGVSSETAKFWFPRLASRLLERRRAHLERCRLDQEYLAKYLIDSVGFPRYQSGEWQTEREMIRKLSYSNGISIWALRRALEKHLKGTRGESPRA